MIRLSRSETSATLLALQTLRQSYQTHEGFHETTVLIGTMTILHMTVVVTILVACCCGVRAPHGSHHAGGLMVDDQSI